MTGACGVRFTLLNLRTDTKFVLITGGLGSNLQAPNFTIIAQSPVITNKNINQPTLVRDSSVQAPVASGAAKSWCLISHQSS